MREEAASRRDTPFVEVLTNGVTKVAPIAAWSARQIHAYMTQHQLPYHPLWHQGYTSIGCALHTQKPIDPNDPRSGRWAGQGKTECGIHDIGKPPLQKKSRQRRQST
jgi:phosphoadenosine phosphosulfate reductase